MLPLLFFVTALDPVQVIPLEGETFHVQGIVVESNRLYLTSVDREARKGYLFEYELPTGKRLRTVELQEGERFHPGGFDADANSFWIPVAEYKKSSTAVIQKINRATLAIEASFFVNDHIGCLAVGNDRLYGGNWDARRIYEWSRDGQEIRVRDNPSPVTYQDMKFRAGRLVASGLTSAQTGAVEFLQPETLASVQRIEMGRTDRNVVFTHEGMDTRARLLYFVPEDTPSRLFVFLMQKP